MAFPDSSSSGDSGSFGVIPTYFHMAHDSSTVAFPFLISIEIKEDSLNQNVTDSTESKLFIILKNMFFEFFLLAKNEIHVL